jgi:hypothetical protein
VEGRKKSREASWEERERRDFHGDFTRRKLPAIPGSLSLCVISPPGSPELYSTCQETAREQDSITPSHMGKPNHCLHQCWKWPW